MTWRIHFLAFLGCAFFVKTVVPKAISQTGESAPYIATGDQRLQETQCFEPISLQVGDHATFYCLVNVTLVCDTVGLANQTPETLWLLNGERIGKGFERLLIQNVSLHAGVYTCVVSSENWTSNASSVIEYINPQQPRIISEFKSERFTDNYKIIPIMVGSNVTAFGKSLLMLSCNVSGNPRPSIEWSRENGKIEKKYFKGDSLLLPHNVVLSGRYVCRARNLVGQTELASHIKFVDPVLPTIVSFRKKLTAIHGENQVRLRAGDDITTIAGTEVVIRCLASGTPDPKIIWYHNDRLCPTKHLKSYDEGVVSFHREAIQASDGGNYTCIAHNEFGSISMTSYVNVIDPVMPYINSSSEDVISYDISFPAAKQIGGSLKSLVGASFWLECHVGGIPRPEVTWKKDNLPIHSSKRIKISQKRFEVLGTMMSDTGWYSCIAANGVGTVTKSTFVHLIAPVTPRIRQAGLRRRYLVNNLPTPLHVGVGVNLRILAYRELTIYCSATGFPAPVISWEKNGYPIEDDKDVHVSQGGGQLTFPKLVPSQNGVYACVASNAAGQDRKRTSVVSRLPLRPKIELRKSVLSKFQLSPQRGHGIRVYEIPDGQSLLVAGSDVILECIAKRSFPKAKFKWFKNGRPWKRHTTESFNRSKLKLRDIQKSDEGVYKCFASNMLGQQEKLINIELQDRNRYN
ncbi:hemicentin-2-like [Dendronephthya gigantea]|uniref:hemicentin-2-like n=1 Tax=Dendronephthya gigantea TaxID=151771 RepID=UPI00106B2A8B|nr:hemicentin-2-like [Dendronephthya gigantea]